MNDYPEFTPPAINIPERCLSCPMIKLAAELYQESVEGNEAFIQQRASEASQSDYESLSAFFDEAVSVTDNLVAETFKKTTDDLARIATITDIMPDSQDMTVPDFLRVYRTDENALGDESIGVVYAYLQENRPENDLLIDRLPVRSVAEMTAVATRKALKDAEGRLLWSQEFIDSNIALFDTEQRYRTALAGSAEGLYTEQVQKLIDSCPNGIIETASRFRRKKIAVYCGSQAYKGKN